MPSLIAPPTSGSGKLGELVNRYNQLGEEQHFEKLFYLQQINYFFQKTTTKPELIAWRNQLGEAGLEGHLQYYGIHRDSSQLLQSIEFAKAVNRYTQPDTQPETTQNMPLFDAMTARDLLLNEPFNHDTIRSYVSYNQAIIMNFNADKKLQEKTQRHQHFLGLSYGKIDAIQSFVNQQFHDYQTTILGDPEGNNKNFIFAIDSENEQMVIRVEDRNDLGKEQQLQSHVVSEFFSEDYATIMVPFELDGNIDYRPVVISELAKEGDLKEYAAKFIGKPDDEIVLQAQHFFLQLNDFCLKLMDSGHYHPDIKLSNFLTDGERIIVSDRKTIINKKSPKVREISSSPLYAAPEYQACLSESGESLKAIAHSTTLDMPSYMAYQMGMALKEFIFTSIKGVDHNKFQQWGLFTNNLEAPNDALKNMDVLIQELTRKNPKDRLSIQHAQTLLNQATTLSQEQFMIKLEELSPHTQLSTNAGIELLTKALTAEKLTPELQCQLEELAMSQSLSTLCLDPRANLTSLLVAIPLQKINHYFKQVDDQLLAMDLEKANPFEKLFYNMGLGIPSRSSIADLGKALPKMDATTKFALSLSESIPGINPAVRRQLNEVSRYQDNTTTTTKNSTADIIRLTTNTTNNDRKSKKSTSTELESGTMLINESNSSLDSGTMITKESDASLESGTMITKETSTSLESGTMITKETSTSLDSGSMIIKEDDGFDGDINDTTSSATSNKKKPVEFMRLNKMKLSSAAPKGKDITSTIKQGDKNDNAEAGSNSSPKGR